MKKLLPILFVIVLVSSSYAQDKPTVSEEKNVLKVNSLSLLVGTGSIFYERELSDVTSAQLGLAYLSFTIEDSKFTGIILTPEMRFYVKKNAIDGFYVAPYFRYQRFSLTAKDDSKATYQVFGGGAVFGRQWIFNSGFTLDFFFGGNYGKGDLKITSGTNSFEGTTKFDGFRPRIGLALGFAF